VINYQFLLFWTRLVGCYRVFCVSSIDSDVLPGLYLKVAWGKERKGVFKSGDTVYSSIIRFYG